MQTPTEIQHILEKEEEVAWCDRQNFLSMIFTTVLSPLTLILVIFLIVGVFIPSLASGPDATCTINGVEHVGEACRNASRIFGPIFIGAPIFIFALQFIAAITSVYVITNKRIILRSGLIGADMRSIYYDQVRSVFVNVGLVGKMLNTGRIMIDTGRMTSTSKGGSQTSFDQMNNIKMPYDVYKIIQEFLSERKESMESGRADFESNREDYTEFVRETEKIRRSIQ
ncbi:PH domain-containing protein [Candidatus Nomurabacteria bacterium]|nr:PH domain-containing protein [Candidatus Nomurabacteria bacterium]